MAKTTLFKGVVYLSQEQYNKLIALGAIEVDGNVIQYDESIVYVTPQALPDDYYTKEQTKELIKNQVVSGDEFIVVDEGKPGTINEGKIVVELDKTNIENEKAIENSDKLITSGATFNTLSDKVSAVAKYNTNIVGTTMINNEDGFVGVSAKDTVEDGAASGAFTAGIQLSDTIDTTSFVVYGVNADNSKIAQLYVGLDQVNVTNNTKVEVSTLAKQDITENTKLIQNKNGLYYIKPTDSVASDINPEEVNSPEFEVIRKSDLNNISGGSKLYEHKISINFNSNYWSTIIINTDPTIFTSESLRAFLYNNNYRSQTSFYPVSSGIIAKGTDTKFTKYYGIYCNVPSLTVMNTLRTETTATYTEAEGIKFTTTIELGALNSPDVTDKVTEL